jgi:hypothetical protein
MEHKKSKKELRNFFWNEFIYYCEDTLSFIKDRRLIKIYDLSRELAELSHTTRRIKLTINMADRAIQMLSKMKSKNYEGESLDKDYQIHFDDLIKRISTGYNDITIVLSQETSAQRVMNGSPEHVRKYDELARILRAPTQAVEVFGRFIEECLGIIYGRDFPWELNIPKPIPVTLYSDYTYLSPSKAICAPPNDVMNLCRWSTIAHELMHSKLDDILSSYYNLGYALSTKDSELVKNTQNMLDRLVEDSTETYYQFVELRDLFAALMKLKAAEVYRQAYSLLLHDDYYMPKHFLNIQFQELLCDIACTRVSGPAEVIVRSYTDADLCRNPELDVFCHLHDLVHPPNAVRVMYEYELIKSPAMNISGERMRAIEKQLLGIVGIDIFGRETSSAEDLSRYLIKTYFDAVKELLPDMSKLVDKLVAEPLLFDQSRWNRIVDSYKTLVEAKTLTGESLRPFDLSNMAWLKVMDIFDETVGRGESYDQFKKNRKRETDFFSALWKIAHTGVNS